MEGQWAPVQSPLDLLLDPQMEANGYIVPVTDMEGNERKLVANPVQFDETAAGDQTGPAVRRAHRRHPARARQVEDEILALKLEGAIT